MLFENRAAYTATCLGAACIHAAINTSGTGELAPAGTAVVRCQVKSPAIMLALLHNGSTLHAPSTARSGNAMLTWTLHKAPSRQSPEASLTVSVLATGAVQSEALCVENTAGGAASHRRGKRVTKTQRGNCALTGSVLPLGAETLGELTPASSNCGTLSHVKPTPV